MKSNAMRASLISAVLLLTPLAVVAQVDPNMPTMPGTGPGTTSSSNGQTTTPGVKNSNGSVFAQDSSANGSGSPDAAAMRDKVFMHEISEDMVVEVALGKLAVQKASNDDVKKFGQAMVDDHAPLSDLMKPIASELGVKEPTKMDKAGQQEYDKLKALSGSDFDKEFLLYIVMEHRKTLKTYRDEVIVSNDTELKDAAMSSAKLVVQHTRTAIALAKANGVTLPPMEQHPKP
jgi:putative membrane protein